MRKILLEFLSVTLVFLLNACTQPVDPWQKEGYLILDMVHHNPGEKLTESAFNNPQKLEKYGYNGQVINDFKFIHSAITYHSFDSTLFPLGTMERSWMDSAALQLEKKIELCKKANISAYCFIDIIVLPKKLVEKYHFQMCNEDGKISLEKPLTQEIHRIMIREIFERFPALDGVVVRTGETYLHNVPYHTGNTPILDAEQSHITLINLLRDEICVKLNKKLIYRTWDFGNFHVKPDYYLKVTNLVDVHSNLYFSIKHTEGDYHRTYKFNPTLTLGKHKQIVEIQCQREYEGKGAYPNYIMEGLINGFEEYAQCNSPKSLRDIIQHPNFAGVWTWSRGGGWVGPYIKNEFWCDVNAYVISHYARNPERTEEEIFMDYAREITMDKKSAEMFRQLCLLSAKGIVRGRNSLAHPIDPWWTRDQFIGGLDKLKAPFEEFISKNQVDEILKEKQECVEIWDEIYRLSSNIHMKDSISQNYLNVSSNYGRIHFSILKEGWTIMLLGLEGDLTGTYRQNDLKDAIARYDSLWIEYHALSQSNTLCASLYVPYSFDFHAPGYQDSVGMETAVDQYRIKICNN